MARGTLDGRGIVVTRPREQAAGLAAKVEAEGGRALVHPALEILDAPDAAAVNAILDQLESFDLAVFISPSAVQKAMNLLRARRGDAPWPARVAVAAVGRGSRRELERQGVRDVVAPAAQADSEALLALPLLQEVAGRRVVVFRGDGGRELLGDTLAARGATVTYAECYRRARPPGDLAPLLHAWARGEVHAVVVTSSEALANFVDMVGRLGQAWLRATPMFVAHERIAEAARRAGVQTVRVAGAGDDEMLAALVAYFAPAR